MPGPTEYVIWTKVGGGATLYTLYTAGTSLTAQATQDFLTTAKNNAGWTSGLVYFHDVSGDCYSTSGATQQNAPSYAIQAQYGQAGTTNAICSPPANDTHIYNWLVVDMTEDCSTITGSPQAYKQTITTASQGSTFAAIAQGSYDFWDALGQPTDWITINGDTTHCYRFVDTNLPLKQSVTREERNLLHRVESNLIAHGPITNNQE